jgi:bZIP transcription factor
MQSHNNEYICFEESSLSNNEGRGSLFALDDSWFHAFVDGDRLFGDFCRDYDANTSGDNSDGSSSFLTPTFPLQSIHPTSDRPSPNPSIPHSPPSTAVSDYEDSASIFSTNSSLAFLSRTLPSAYSSTSSRLDTKLVDRRERNRQAAERCRKRKADLVTCLRASCEVLQREKEALMAENARLRAMLK